MAHIGYVRVSSVGQNTTRQLAAIKLDRVFEEKASAKDTNRPQLQECLRYLRHGDTLHVHSMDRLSRNLFDLQKLINELTESSIAVRFHKENLTFTGDDSPMNKLLLQLLGAISQFERELINERRREGIEAARRAGKQIGAARKLTDQDVADIREKLAAGATKKGLAAEYGISRQTLYSALG